MTNDIKISRELIEVVNVCSVKGVLAGGRAICGNVGCGEPWKCWSEEPCDKKIEPAEQKELSHDQR